MAEAFAFIFPGQGSQRVGMMAAAAEAFPEVMDTFTEASDALGYDLWQLVSEDPSGQLDLTEYTQPALLASSVALWRAWLANGGARPVAMSGHSLGEFSALVCAGCLRFLDAVQLVRKRGQFMQSAVPEGQGAMAAVLALEDAVVEQVCAEVTAAGDLVAAVNYNSPGQIVIAGFSAGVDKATAALLEQGARKVLPLPVSAPFHTELMQPAGLKLREALQEITLSAPEIPVVHNVHAGVELDPTRILELLVKQIYSPVRWSDCMAALMQRGASQFVECGPGRVLSGLVRRIDKSASCTTVEEPDNMLAAIAALA